MIRIEDSPRISDPSIFDSCHPACSASLSRFGCQGSFIHAVKMSGGRVPASKEAFSFLHQLRFLFPNPWTIRPESAVASGSWEG